MVMPLLLDLSIGRRTNGSVGGRDRITYSRWVVQTQAGISQAVTY
jgi:hypothetical protein